MRHMKKLVEAFNQGTRITNDELVALRDAMKVAAEALIGLGPYFATAYKEANMIHIRTEEFCVARGIK